MANLVLAVLALALVSSVGAGLAVHQVVNSQTVVAPHNGEACDHEQNEANDENETAEHAATPGHSEVRDHNETGEHNETADHDADERAEQDDNGTACEPNELDDRGEMGDSDLNETEDEG